MTSLLGIRGLHHERADRELFGGLDLEIHAGELLQVSGPNGHGKSTLLRILAGLLTPDQGERHWRGGEFEAWKDERVAPIAWAGERSGWAPHLSVLSSWNYLRALRGDPPCALADAWLDDRWGQRRFADLSTGQRKRVQLAAVLASSACLWLLDEPLSGLDRTHAEEWQCHMQLALKRDVAIVIVSHEDLRIPVDRQFEWTVPA